MRNNIKGFAVVQVNNVQAVPRVGKTEELYLTGTVFSNTDKRYTVGNASINAVRICIHFRSS